METNRDLHSSLLIALVVVVAISVAFFWGFFRFGKLVEVYSPFTVFLLTSYTIIVLIYLPTRIILYTLYKPFEDRGYRPRVTVVVPAFNEGPFVEKSLNALVRSTYPKDLMEVIAVDDGSSDDTFKYIQKMSRRYPNLIKAIRFPSNRGKREAMAEGVKLATGEIIVFIDSDTRIKRNAIEHLVAPFTDPKVGGVTGKVKVENWRTNILTRMLSVRYVMSFDFYRSTSSVFGGITCLSGVISAYRKDLLEGIIPQWKEQMFLGRKCTFGDDRSLTNHILKKDYLTVYSRKAVARTLAPENIKKLCRMLIRWNKSFLRETIILMNYILRPRIMKKRKMLLFEGVMTTVMPFLMIGLVATIYIRIFMDPAYLLTVVLSITTMAMIYMLFYVKAERNWRFVYGIAYAFFFITILIWLLPYAMFTINRTQWGTR
ncbi:MAG: glycosyltransferase [Thermoplasmatota archaeon]